MGGTYNATTETVQFQGCHVFVFGWEFLGKAICTLYGAHIEGETIVAGRSCYTSTENLFFFPAPFPAKIATLIENWQHLLLSITILKFLSGNS